MTRHLPDASQKYPGTAVLAPPLGWSRTFQATPGQAGEARRFLTGILGGHPANCPHERTVWCEMATP